MPGERWISMVQAAELAGCSPALLSRAAKRGEIDQRRLPRRDQPSLDLDSVVRWSERRRDRLARQEQRRAARQRLDELSGRPDLEHVWLDYGVAAELLGVSRVWVSRLAREDRLPFTVAGGQRWFRRDHLDLWLTARVAQRAERSGDF